MPVKVKPAATGEAAIETISKAVAPVFDAYRRASVENALVNEANMSVSQKLIALGRMDGAGRDIMEKTDLMSLPAGLGQKAADVAWAEIRVHDRDNQNALRRIMPNNGWFDRRLVGARATDAAFLIVQHAVNDDRFMRDVLERMRPDVGTDRIDGTRFAELLDRVEMQDGQPQTYGTQFKCTSNRWTLYTVRDMGNVDRIRKIAGFTTSLTEDVQAFAAMPPCVVPK